MLEPLLRCNLACAGCGKIDYPAPILNQRLSVQECLDADTECGAPVIAVAGGEPLLHKEMPQIISGLLARKKYVYLCTNALLLEKKMDDYQPNPFFSWDVHLDGDPDHARPVGLPGTACSTARWPPSRRPRRAASGSRSTAPCSTAPTPSGVADFFDEVMAMGVDGIMTAPGYAYERAPDQAHFLNRQKTQAAVPRHLPLREGEEVEVHAVAPLFLNFLAGNETYHCTPWGKPLRTVFGWQRPCYLLGEGLYVDPQGADGRHRLGPVRHRQTTRNAPTAWCIPATSRPR